MTIKPLICVIDDDPAIRRTLCTQLEAAGFRTIEAGDGSSGLAIVKEKQPAVAVVDIIMPEREGLSTIQDIRDMYPDIRILAISGGGIGDATRYLQFAESLGANDTMIKPIRGAEFIDRIKRLLATPS